MRRLIIAWPHCLAETQGCPSQGAAHAAVTKLKIFSRERCSFFRTCFIFWDCSGRKSFRSPSDISVVCFQFEGWGMGPERRARRSVAKGMQKCPQGVPDRWWEDGGSRLQPGTESVPVRLPARSQHCLSHSHYVYFCWTYWVTFSELQCIVDPHAFLRPHFPECLPCSCRGELCLRK